MPLTIDLVGQVKDAVVVQLGVSEKFSINKKEERYTKIHITHDF